MGFLAGHQEMFVVELRNLDIEPFTERPQQTIDIVRTIVATNPHVPDGRVNDHDLLIGVAGNFL